MMKKVRFLGDDEKSVIIMGANAWATTISSIVAKNVLKYDCFDKTVKIYCGDEIVADRKLSTIINTEHENQKYLPGFQIPTNVVAVPNMEAASDADVIIWALSPNISKNVAILIGDSIKASAVVLSIVKGFNITNDEINLMSETLYKYLQVEICVMSGANLASEVASEQFCESTIGCRDKETGQLFKKLIQTDYFKLSVVEDIPAVEVCGVLKNIVAIGAGIIDGLEFGNNTKAAVMRLGLMEMIKYSQEFYPGSKMETFLESCGVADLNATCYGGRSRKVAEAFVRTEKNFKHLEEEILDEEIGPQLIKRVVNMLHDKGLTEKFPLFVAIHRICIGELLPRDLIDCIRCHPEPL